MFDSIKPHARLLALMIGLSSANADEVAPQIPAQFRATWAATPADCLGGNLIVVRADAIVGEGGESGWMLKKILQSDPTTLVAIYDFSGEGLEEPDLRISLHLLSKDRLLTDGFGGPTLFERCNDQH